MIPLSIHPSTKNLSAAVVHAEGIAIGPAGHELRDYCDRVAARAKGQVDRSARDAQVRGLLRLGGFKPSGRSKPAHEYLLRTVAQSAALPAINNAVDLINGVSLDAGLPISLLALDRVAPPLSLRYGAAGESFVFNSSGQTIDLEGLICLCDAANQPFGTPVKDSLAGKVTESDADVLACVYLPRDSVSAKEAEQWAQTLASGFNRFCGSDRCDWLLV